MDLNDMYIRYCVGDKPDTTNEVDTDDDDVLEGEDDEEEDEGDEPESDEDAKE